MTLARSPLTRFPLQAVFRRRPLFWLALAAALGAWAAVRLEAPLPLYLAVALAGSLLLPFRRYGLAVLLVALGIGGLRSKAALAPPRDPHLAPGKLLTVRGGVTRAWGEGPGRGRRAILVAASRLEHGVWLPLNGVLGFFADEAVTTGEVLELSGVLERPLPPTQPGGRSERLDWARKGAGVVLDLRPQGLRRLGSAPLPAWRQWSISTRQWLLDWNRRTLSSEGAFIANQFLIGDDTAEDPSTRAIAQAFRDSGTIHLLVVSGTQVSLVIAGFLWLGMRFYGARWLFWGLALGALAGYTLLTDGSPPVQRAAVMGIALLAALALEREVDPENGLGLAALLLFALDPLALFDLGFALSFAAVWGLGRLTPLLYTALAPAPQSEELSMRQSALLGAWEKLSGMAAASFGAFLATAPLLAVEFHRVSWISVPANIPMAAQATLLMYAATAHALLGVLGIPWLAGCIDAQARGLSSTASAFAAFPGAMQDAFPPPALFVPAFLLAAMGMAALAKARRQAVAACLGLAGALAVVCAVPAPAPDGPRVRTFDVGQGDGILLEGAGGGRLLVDAGPPQAGERLVRALSALRIASLDAVLATHVDADHVGGMPHLLRALPVGVLLYHDDDRTDQDWQQVLAAAEERLVPRKRVSAGQRLAIGGAVLDILGPMADLHGVTSSTNDRSVVARWECGPASVLLAGDSGGDSEARLLRWGSRLQADVLKVGHHGSAGSTSNEFLRTVVPQVALISCGRNNRYGHPSRDTLARLYMGGIRPFRTDTGGMLTVTWPGKSPRIDSYVRE